MDIFDTPNYKICKVLLRYLGCWPFQSYSEKCFLRTLVILLDVSIIIPEILFNINTENLDLVIDYLPIAFIHLTHICKYATYLNHRCQIKELFTMVKNDLELCSEYEISIINQYSKSAKIISISLASGYFLSASFFLVSMVIPRILSVFNPQNTSIPFVYVFGTDYLVEVGNHDKIIVIHQILGTVLTVSSTVASDITYTVFCHHVSGMFAVLRYRLSQIQNSVESQNAIPPNKLIISKKISDCIQRHKRAIWFCDLMEYTFTDLMFLILLLEILGLSISGLQAMGHLDDPKEMIRSMILGGAQLVHIFYYCWHSQMIVDNSSEIFEAAYDVKWYTFLDSSSKSLSFMMFRSTKPCIQTAGRMFPMTLEFFTVVVKTSMSYFTVLSNVR